MPSNAHLPPQPQTESQPYSDALLQETARVIVAVQTPLRDLVSVRLQSSNNDPHEAAQLVLTLHFTNHIHASNLWRLLNRNAVDAKRISAALDAIMLVYSHSRSLASHGKLHADFWTQLLSSKVMLTEAHDEIMAWTATEMGDAKRFSLRMVLDFGGSKRGRLDKKWLDAVLMFMTESLECSKMMERHNRRKRASQEKVLFGLSFTNSRLAVKCLVMLQRLLDCTAPGCNRHYGIDMLDLSHNAMTAKQLEVVTQILKRNHVYQIQDIRLDETIKTSPMQSETMFVHRTSACEVSRTATEWQSDIRTTTPSTSLATDQLGIQHVVSRFAEQVKLRTINLVNSDITSAGVDALANVLYDPVAEFRRPGLPEDKFAMDAVLVGVVEEGATVYSSADTHSKPLATLVRRQELEILHSRNDDDWVCVVVAGVGLGWLQTHHVISVEHDLEKHDGPADARFDLVVRNPPARTERVMPRETHTFIETVGKHLRSLSVRNSGRLPLIKIIYHCKNLARLDLEGCDLRGESLSDLLRCLRSHLGRQIISLNLNRTCVNDDDMVRLADLLGDPQELRKLKELRVYNIQVTLAGLESLHAVLVKNNTLAMLEYGQLGDDFDRDESRARCARIRASRRTEQLTIVPVSVNQKIAFISAVLGPRSNVKAAGALCVGAFQLIFQFAKEPNRRTISWVTPSDRLLERKADLSASRSTVSKRWQSHLPLVWNWKLLE